MPRVVVLTCSERGTAAHHLPIILERSSADVRMVVISEGRAVDRKNLYRKKFHKMRKIGPFGAINGVRMRRWYNEDGERLVRIEPMADICRRHGIPLVRVAFTNGEDTVAAFRRAEADIGLSLGNGYIASRVFTIPRLGMLNIHGAILPDYQNAQSVLWELHNGSIETGYTIHCIDKGIDAGPIVLQERFPLELRPSFAETVTWNSIRILTRSGLGLVRVLEELDGHLARARVQCGGSSYTTPSLREFIRMYVNWKRLIEAERAATGRLG